MKLGIIIQKMIILLQLTIVMPRKRVRYTSIEDTSMEGDVFYYRECKGSTPRPGTGLKHARVTPPPPRQLMMMQCKMCVTVCCGDECQCKNPAPLEKIQQAIGEVQPENSECKSCVNMCCGSACQCKDQLMPTADEIEANRTTTPSSVTAKPEESQEGRVAFTVKHLNREAFVEPTVARIINMLCKDDFDIVGVDEGSGDRGRTKSLTLNIVKKVGREKGNVTLIYDETASRYDFYHFCVLNVGAQRKHIDDTIDKLVNTSRRDSSTRDYIRRVLSHDGDISAILKDLVRVTLQKVDLMKKMDSRRKNAADNMDVEDSDANILI
ncbi:uncharacterized protein LOC121727340 [Aricia agestis]|uniref:uncharacterized protein LOC121727340 n=1 Tax=Aricia agestis TaxID=91739 RepID=UPI001C2053C9|nr:uncharacterized protein LOC121727340 [Aricia agestis]